MCYLDVLKLFQCVLNLITTLEVAVTMQFLNLNFGHPFYADFIKTSTVILAIKVLLRVKIVTALTSSLFLMLWNSMPVEHQVPIKATHRQVGGLLVGQSVITNNVNNRTYHIGGVLSNSAEQRLQPAW